MCRNVVAFPYSFDVCKVCSLSSFSFLMLICVVSFFFAKGLLVLLVFSKNLFFSLTSLFSVSLISTLSFLSL